MDELLEFKSDKATYTARAGDDFLGGGQTAAVYRASAGDGQVFALKWLTDAVYEQRFFQEVDWLNELAYAPEAYGLRRNGQLLTPRVYDEQRQGERRFFVMDLAPGQPLDEVLRRRGRLSEPAGLAIAVQLARVFTALHEILRRSYLDFQPRNVFWQEQSGQIMVIDWNLLSPKDRMDVAADLRSIGVLLYRMLLGAQPPTGRGDARGRVVTHEAWQEISLGARVLLQDLLEPRPGQRIEDARTARDRLDALCQRWEKPGDDLVREAAPLFKQVRNGETATTVQDEILLDVAVCLDLAGRQTGALALSNAMAMVRHNLEQEVAGRRQDLTALALAISFFRSGDLDTAALLFEQALADAGTPEDELQVRRWQAVLEARHAHTAGFDGAGRQRIEALLDRFQEATRAYLERSLSPTPDLNVWRERHTEARDLAGSGLPAVEVLVSEASAWPVVLALQTSQSTVMLGKTLDQRIKAAKNARETIDDLEYGEYVWAALSMGDEAANRTIVDDAIGELEEAERVERQWSLLRKRASEKPWKETDVDKIRLLLQQIEELPISVKPALGLLGMVIGQHGDKIAKEVAEVLLEGLLCSPKVIQDPLTSYNPDAERLALVEGQISGAGTSQDDRAWIMALERWLPKIQRIEGLLDLWERETEAIDPDQIARYHADRTNARPLQETSDSGSLRFPASWILGELQALAQHEAVINERYYGSNGLEARMAQAAMRAVRTCAQLGTGLAQARLLLDCLGKEKVVGVHDRDRLRVDLDSFNADQRLEAVKLEIGQTREALAVLRAEISAEEVRKRQVDHEVEEYHVLRLKEIEAELAKKRSVGQEEITNLRRRVEQVREELETLRIAKQQEIHELREARASLQDDVTRLREEKGYLESPPAVIAQQQTTMTTMQARIDKLESELKNPERLGTIADTRIRELTGIKAQLELRIKALEARLSQQGSGQPPGHPASKESGWQRIYDATKQLQSGVLSDVKNALDEWKAVAREAESNGDSKLLKETHALVNQWNPSYEANSQKWLSTSGVLIDFTQMEHASLILEELLANGVQGYTRRGETQKRLAGLWQTMVDLINEDMSTRRLNSQQQQAALEQMYSYVNKSRRLAEMFNDPEIRQVARRIHDTYTPLVAPRGTY